MLSCCLLQGYHLSAARADLTSEWQVKDSGNLFLYNMNRTGWYQVSWCCLLAVEEPLQFGADL